MSNLDQEAHLLMTLENPALYPDQFDHVDHVRLGYYLILTLGINDAIPRFVNAIKNFSTHKNVSTLYHETITQFFLQTISRRLRNSPKPLGKRLLLPTLIC